VLQFFRQPGKCDPPRADPPRRESEPREGAFSQKDAKVLVVGLRCWLVFFAGSGGIFRCVVSSSQNGIFFAVLAPAVSRTRICSCKVLKRCGVRRVRRGAA